MNVYLFTLSRGVGNDTQISVDECDLTENQKNLLVSELVSLYKKLPKELKDRFLRTERLQLDKSNENDDLPF